MFIVQGEGRGHMTQALAVKELIEKEGHEIVCVLVGNIKRHSVPDFFKNSFKCRVIDMRSPSFVFDGGVHMGKTFIHNFLTIPRYFLSLKRIRQQIHKVKPDVIINFYEPLFGIYRMFGGQCKKSFAIAHQFMFLHPNYVANKAKEKKFELWGGKLYTNIVGYKSKKIALSIAPEEPLNGITIVPPVLREDVFKDPEKVYFGGFILVYSLSRDYGKSFLMESPQNIKYEVFTEKFWPSDSDTLKFGNITFNKLDGKKFLDYMKRCDMVVCTAGFETASEASYLGKRIMVIPTENHFEQYFNAWDFQLAGLAKMRYDFKNISLSDVEIDFEAISKFRNWIGGYKEEFKKALEL